MAFVRQHEHQIDSRCANGSSFQGDELEGGVAAEKVVMLGQKLDLHVCGLGWNGAVHVMLKERLQFRATFVKPLRLRGDAAAIEHDERIGQRRLWWQQGRFRE